MNGVEQWVQLYNDAMTSGRLPYSESVLELLIKQHNLSQRMELVDEFKVRIERNAHYRPSNVKLHFLTVGDHFLRDAKHCALPSGIHHGSPVLAR